MQQASNTIKNYANSIDLSSNYLLRFRILRIFIATTVLFVLLYLFFIGNLILNVLERNSYEGQSRVLGSEVTELELKYLNASQEIDLEYANGLGYKQVEKNFASRQHFSMQ